MNVLDAVDKCSFISIHVKCLIRRGRTASIEGISLCSCELNSVNKKL